MPKVELSPKGLKTLLFQLSVAVAIIAIVDQLRRPADERTWYGTILFVPYDFRPPTPGRFLRAWYNPDDPRLFTPRDFGVGWALNFAQVYRLIKRSTPQ